MPGAIGIEILRHVFNDRIEYQTIASLAGQRGICLQFREDMVMCVIAVQADQNARAGRRGCFHLIDDLRIDGGSLDHVNPARHRVRLDCRAIMGANIDINPQNPPLRRSRVQHRPRLDRIAVVEHCQHCRTLNEGAAMGNAGFDDQVRLHIPDDFLKGHHVCR